MKIIYETQMLNPVSQTLLNKFSYFFLMTWMIWFRVRQKNLFMVMKFIDEALRNNCLIY
jgi:membrane-bound metal-dependent hydrolase YbcI (DUF457 family)